MSDDQLLGNPLPDYHWPDLHWVPMPFWVGLGMEVLAFLGFIVVRKLVRR
jgi:hypothetical protein